MNGNGTTGNGGVLVISKPVSQMIKPSGLTLIHFLSSASVSLTLNQLQQMDAYP